MRTNGTTTLADSNFWFLLPFLRSGLIDVNEWHSNLRKLGIDVDIADDKALFMKLDSDQSGSVSGDASIPSLKSFECEHIPIHSLVHLV